MKKTIQKLMAALLAGAMVCAMAIPAFAYNPGETEEDLNTKHNYGAFQIFTGDVSEDNKKISNVAWGQNITEPDIFLDKLMDDPTIGGKFETDFTAQDVLAVISQWSNSDDNSIAFARVVCSYLYPTADAKPEPVDQDHTGGIEIHKPGYYLIVDISPFDDDDFYHAYNSFLLTVTKAPYHFIIKHKVVKPTVKKEVYDNDDKSSYGDDNGWRSSADHAINEKFQFKLTATLPASKDNGRAYDFYKKYTVCFNDTLSAGITFDNLDTVKIANVDGGDSKEIADTDYTLVKDLHEAGQPSSFTLSIDNVKNCATAAGLNLNDGATITVTYTAHLNDKAAVNGSTENKNSVQLQYSNNPRIDTSLDHTTTSEVCVYTYQLNNTKRQDSETGDVLEGAGFRLYSDIACNEEQEIKLKQNEDGTYSRDFSTEGKGVEMKSADDGTFNVKGLDAGTYYLKETSTPTGFNTCPVTTVVIKANHTENNVDLNGSTINGKDVGASGLSTTIINIKAGGITLPSTGGIGTTLFYVIGGGLMVAAIVLLVTKKRMENK